VEPQFYHEVIRDANWRDAMAMELETLELNKTWVIVDLPPEWKSLTINRYTKSRIKLMGV